MDIMFVCMSLASECTAGAVYVGRPPRPRLLFGITHTYSNVGAALVTTRRHLPYFPSPLPPLIARLTQPFPRCSAARFLRTFRDKLNRVDKIFIKAFPRGFDGRTGILESTGLVEVNDCLTAINGVPLDKSSGLREVMASIRAAESPLSLRFARYPPPPLRSPSSSSSSSSSLFSSSAGPALASAAAAGGGGAGNTSFPAGGADSLDGGGGSGGSAHAAGARSRAGTGDAEMRETAAADPELDDVLNSALVLGLGERVAAIQRRNAQLLQEVDRIGRAAADKRQVRPVCAFYPKSHGTGR